jgi:hypothetical protein
MVETPQSVTNGRGPVARVTAGTLLDALKRLDALLESAVVQARPAYGAEPLADPFRGLYISPEQAERTLAREPGTPVLHVDAVGGRSEPCLGWLAQAFALSAFDLDVVLIALAPELDLRYERLYAYLQDDVTKKRPTVDLVLNLLCPNAEAKLARRRHFASDAPLLRHALVHLLADPTQVEPSGSVPRRGLCVRVVYS